MVLFVLALTDYHNHYTSTWYDQQGSGPVIAGRAQRTDTTNGAGIYQSHVDNRWWREGPSGEGALLGSRLTRVQNGLSSMA